MNQRAKEAHSHGALRLVPRALIVSSRLLLAHAQMRRACGGSTLLREILSCTYDVI